MESQALSDARQNAVRALAELKRREHEEASLARRLNSDGTLESRAVVVIRESGTRRRVCAECRTEIVSFCVRGSESGEIMRCQNGHDCSKRFVVVKRVARTHD